jgi:hypothetical protein
MIMKTALLLMMFCLCNNDCFAGCWHRSYANVPVAQNVIPLPVVQQQPLVFYAPLVVQERRWVPVVENRVIYRPVDSYYLNTLHYYPSVPTYGYQYYNDPWNGYNY